MSTLIANNQQTKLGNKLQKQIAALIHHSERIHKIEILKEHLIEDVLPYYDFHQILFDQFGLVLVEKHFSSTQIDKRKFSFSTVDQNVFLKTALDVLQVIHILEVLFFFKTFVSFQKFFVRDPLFILFFSLRISLHFEGF